MFRLILILLITIPVFSQTEQKTPEKKAEPTKEDREVRPISSLPPEFGTTTELKGLTKIYVRATDLEARKLILKEFSKEPRLVIADKVQDAELLLSYASASRTTGATLSPFGSIQANNMELGEIAAMVRAGVDSEGKRLIRILWSSRKKQQWSSGITLSRHPAVNGAREFLKVWQKENPTADKK